MHKSNVSLIVQPGDSFFPLIEAIDEARHSINVTIFRMDDPVIQESLLEAAGRGVRVRALVAARPRGWAKENRKLLKELKRSGIETTQPAADSPKRRYHYKILTVDDTVSHVLTFNPTRENLHYTRDYGVVTSDRAIAAELNRLFEADWSDRPFVPNHDLPLAISPYNSRGKILEFLRSAQTSIHISDAKLRDQSIVTLLREKAERGVDVRVLGGDPPDAILASEIKFRRITRFKMHAKCVVVDSKRALVGSMNLRNASLDKRREVAIFVDDRLVVAQLEHVFASDWSQKSRSLTTVTVPAHDVEGAAGTETQTRTNPLLASPPPSHFILLSRTDVLSRYRLHEGENSIGRGTDNEVNIPHPSVSRSHARIFIDGESHYLVDLDSQNGTFINGERVTGSTPLNVGDIIGIAQADEFRFIEV